MKLFDSSHFFQTTHPRSLEMSGKANESTHSGKLSVRAAESPALQNSTSLQRIALRLTIVLAIGFNVSGFRGRFGGDVGEMRPWHQKPFGITDSAGHRHLHLLWYCSSGHRVLSFDTSDDIDHERWQISDPEIKAIAIYFHHTLRSLGGARRCQKSGDKCDELCLWRRRYSSRNPLRGLWRVCHCVPDGIDLV